MTKNVTNTRCEVRCKVYAAWEKPSAKWATADTINPYISPALRQSDEWMNVRYKTRIVGTNGKRVARFVQVCRVEGGFPRECRFWAGALNLGSVWLSSSRFRFTHEERSQRRRVWLATVPMGIGSRNAQLGRTPQGKLWETAYQWLDVNSVLLKCDIDACFNGIDCTL
jgi:hypothetical protein